MGLAFSLLLCRRFIRPFLSAGQWFAQPSRPRPSWILEVMLKGALSRRCWGWWAGSGGKNACRSLTICVWPWKLCRGKRREPISGHCVPPHAYRRMCGSTLTCVHYHQQKGPWQSLGWRSHCFSAVLLFLISWKNWCGAHVPDNMSHRHFITTLHLMEFGWPQLFYLSWVCHVLLGDTP